VARKAKYNYPIVYVEWTDTATEDAWQLTEDAVNNDPHPAFTTGWLLKETKNVLYISHSYSPDDKGRDEEVMGKVSIPRSTVTKMVVIKKA